MLCDICQKRPAKIYYTEIKNGEKKEQHLCEECAGEKTSFHTNATGNDFEQMLTSFLSNILGNVYGEEQELKSAERKIILRCETCGMTAEELQRTGKFGCVNCYTTFEDIIERSLRQIQGGNRHNGKRPVGENAEDTVLGEEVKTLDEIELLSQELKAAIEIEDFEIAAKLRDRIRELKKVEDT